MKSHIVDVDDVGSDSTTDSYNGDTSCSESLPILCLKKEGLPQPSYISTDFYNGWTGGHIKLTAPHFGAELTSRTVADNLCAAAFGSGWAMAEHHDGNGGWAWYAYGNINTTSRFWVTVNDQPSSPWSCPAPAPFASRISGTISTNHFPPHPIVGATVDAGNGYKSTTDANGEYKILNIPPGTYTIRASLNNWTFGSTQYQNDHYQTTISTSLPEQTVNITGWEHDPIVFVHGWKSDFDTDFSMVSTNLEKDAGYYTNRKSDHALITNLWWTPPFIVNAQRVMKWIDDAKYVTGRSQVILYTQSMGGPVARAYVESGLYRNDVSAIFSYGGPHLGLPMVMTFGCVDILQPAVCEMTTPGMALFNLTHYKRAGVNYHLIGGDAPMWKLEQTCFKIFGKKVCPIKILLPDFDYRNGFGWAMGVLIAGKDDGLVGTCSSTGEIGDNIDRYITHEIHTVASLGHRDYHRWGDGKEISQDGYKNCSLAVLEGSKTVCGILSGGPLPSCLGDSQIGLRRTDGVDTTSSAPELGQLSRIDHGVIYPGEHRIRTLFLEGGAATFSATWGEGSASFKLIDPTGKVIDPAYAASIQSDSDTFDAEIVDEPTPDMVVYTESSTQATYYFPNARPGAWQVVFDGGNDLPTAGSIFTTAANFDSALQATFSSDRQFYEPGRMATLRISLSEGVLSAEAQVRVVSPSGGSTDETVFLTRISATEFEAAYPIPAAPGYVGLAWSLIGLRSDGVTFERGGHEIIQIQSTALQLVDGSITDRGIARPDIAGLNSALAVSLHVSSDYAGGDLGVFAELVDSEGNIIARTNTSVTAQQGDNSVELRFRAEDIYRVGRDGPYTVRNVRIMDERSAPLLSQEIELAHTTAVYSYRSFAPTSGTPSVYLDGPFSVRAGGSVTLTASGVDPEGDTLSYAWDLDQDGSFEVSGQSVVFMTSSSDPAGVRTVRVRVTDPAGNSAVAEAQVETQAALENRPPVALCHDVTVPAACGLSDSVNDGSYDLDPGDRVNCVQTPAGTDEVGSRQVTLTCTDTAGLSSSCEATVTVVAPTGPTLVLAGDSQMLLECGVDTWKDPGAQAWDSCGPVRVHRYNSGDDDGDGIPGALDPDDFGPGPNTSAEGSYPVEYIAWNTAGATVSAVRWVHVTDRTPPTLKLKGPEHMTHPCGSQWQDPGVESVDACYGDLAATVLKTGEVNGWAEGSYTVRYEVRDSGGNSAPPITRTVDVVSCPW